MGAKKTDVVCALFAFFVAAILWFSSQGLSSNLVIGVGASFMPRAIAGGLTLLGAILLFQTLTRKVKAVSAEKPAAADSAGVVRALVRERADIVSLALLLGYVFILQPLGFIIASAAYLFLQMLVMSVPANRRFALFAIISIVSPILIYLMFTRFFSMNLPRGLFGL